jgi:hypothetical protein
MQLPPTPAVVLAALSLLAACGPKPSANATANAGAPTAGAAPASGPDVQITMADLPHPRAGLWQKVVDDGDGKPTTSTNCLSDKTPTMPKGPPGCSQFSMKRTFLGHIVTDMNCVTPQFTMVMHADASGDFQTNMTSDVTMTVSTKQTAPTTTRMHTEDHYLGPCPPGQAPVDAGDSNAAG